MTAPTVFCEECREYKPYTVSEHETFGVLRGRTYTYIGKEAHCSVCGAVVYIPELSDYNLTALYNVFRKDGN